MSSAFHDVMFPSCLTHFLQGGPAFDTLIVTTTSGQEYRKSERQMALYKYKAIACYLNREEYAQITSFFNARYGRAYAFRLRDLLDYEAHGQIIAIGDSKSFEFQLIRTYEDKINNYVRKNILPVKDSVVLKVNGNNTQADINYELGRIKLKESLKEGEILTADFLYDIKVRFDNDQLNFSVSSDDSIILDEINLIEVII